MKQEAIEEGLDERVSVRVSKATKERVLAVTSGISFGGRPADEADIVRMALDFGLTRLEKKASK